MEKIDALIDTAGAVAYIALAVLTAAGKLQWDPWVLSAIFVACGLRLAVDVIGGDKNEID